MIKRIIFISFFCISIIYSQQKQVSNDYIIKFSALDLLTGFLYQSSTIQFGLEKGISKNFSINTEIGYSFHINRKADILSIALDNSSGFTFETEVRNYIDNNPSSYTGNYFSISFLYRYLDAKDHHSVFLGVDEDRPWITYNSNEQYSIFRNEYAFHINYGYQNISISGFTSDFSIGIGLRYISSRTFSAYPISFIDYEFPYNKPFGKGSKLFFSGTAAIRIGWSIK